MAGRVYTEIQPVVGDYAIARITDNIPVVERILERTSFLQRASKNRISAQVIAANVDMVLVIMSMKNPDFTKGFLSRALVAAEWMNLKALVVLNKIDLCEKQDETLTDGIISAYGPSGAGYPLIRTSCVTGAGTEALLEQIRGFTVVMTGPSGAGKTSLVKYYNPSLNVKIGKLNPRTNKGRHTTSSARLIPLEKNTYLIDTPGFRLFSIDHIPRSELQFCFPEFEDYTGKCKFCDCLHISEPDCAVKKAVENTAISKLRYETYLNFMNE